MNRDEPIEGAETISDALLRKFADGKLDDAQAERIALLIESSTELQARLDRLATSPFVETLQRLGPSTSTPLSYAPSHESSDSITHSSSPDSSLSEIAAATPNKILSPLAHSDGRGAGGEGLPASKSLTEALAEFGYQVQKELGRGGMGVVYLAKNTSMDRMEVLKVLNDNLVAKPEARERFLREVRSVSKLSHPSIVTSYSVVPLPNHVVFAMEFVDGKDLHQLVQIQKQRKVPFPIADACRFTSQVAFGLQHAHEKGMVHRDIKPSNIMIFKSDGRFQAKVLDFGLARFTSEKESDGLTQQGQMLGTLEYIAPEQMMNAAKADIRADIYSLGCTFYHLLAGQPPFKGTQGELMSAHMQREPTPINLLRPDVSPTLAALIAKMMAKEKEKRFQTPKEVAEAIRLDQSNNQPAITRVSLEQVVEDSTQLGTLHTRPAEKSKIPRRVIPRRKRPHWVLVSIFGLIAIIGLLSISRVSRKAPSRPELKIDIPALPAVESKKTRVEAPVVKFPSSLPGGANEWQRDAGATRFKIDDNGDDVSTRGSPQSPSHTGEVTKKFMIPAKASFISFTVDGGNNINELYVQLERADGSKQVLKNREGKELKATGQGEKAEGRDTQEKTLYWDISDYQRNEIVIRIADHRKDNNWKDKQVGHIAIRNLKLHENESTLPKELKKTK